MALATRTASASGSSASSSLKPRRKWASIIPELPRAPSTAARAMVRAVSGSGASPSARRASATARRVRLKLVPVSPSGTGKTLIRLISSRPAVTQSAAAKIDRARRGPSTYAIPTLMPGRSLRDDRDAHLRVNLGMQPDAHQMVAQRLDRVIQLDPAPVHLVPRPAQRVRQILCGDRAEELAFLAGLTGDGEGDGRQRGRGLLRLHLLGLVPRAAGAGLGGDPLLVALGRLVGEA